MFHRKAKRQYLEQEFWTKERIDHVPEFPVIEIDLCYGEINSYLTIEAVQDRWNHFVFEQPLDVEVPSFFIDSHLKTFEIVFHKDGFKYPKIASRIDKTLFLEMLKGCDLKNYSEFELLTMNQIFDKVLKGDFKYDWQD